jgi:hypothetical protein
MKVYRIVFKDPSYIIPGLERRLWVVAETLEAALEKFNASKPNVTVEDVSLFGDVLE